MPKNPIGKITDTAVVVATATVKDPVGAAKLAAGTAKQAAGQVVGTALTTAAVVTDKVKTRGRKPAPRAASRPEPVGVSGAESRATTPTKKATTKTTSKKTTAKSTSAKKTTPAKKATAKKSATKKTTPTKKATTKKAASPTPDDRAGADSGQD